MALMHTKQVIKRWAMALLVLGVLGIGFVRLQQPATASAYANKPKEGAEVFVSSGCTHCHGNDGQGTDKAPSLHGLRKTMPEAKISDQIVHGGQGMPAFGDVLKPEQVDQLVAFLRAKKWVTPPQPADKPVATP